jgi:hypothetical protein
MHKYLLKLTSVIGRSNNKHSIPIASARRKVLCWEQRRFALVTLFLTVIEEEEVEE